MTRTRRRIGAALLAATATAGAVAAITASRAGAVGQLRSTPPRPAPAGEATASAVPPFVGGAAPGYGATADGSLLKVQRSGDPALRRTAGMQLGHSQAVANSRQSVTASARATDLDVTGITPPVAPVLISRVQQDAPPQHNAPVASHLAAVTRAPYAAVAATGTSAYAPGTGAAGCAPGGLIAEATTTTRAASALPTGRGALLTLPGEAASVASTGLITVPGQDGYGVYARHELRISTMTLLDGALRVTVGSTPTLTAVAAGTARSRVDYSPPSLEVTAPGGTPVTLNPVTPVATFPLPDGGRATLTVGTLHEDSVTPLRIQVTATLLHLTVTSAAGVTTEATVGTQSLVAAAPARGVSCASGLPTLGSPAEPITIQPVFSNEPPAADANALGGTGAGGASRADRGAARPEQPDPAATLAGSVPPELPATGVGAVAELTTSGAGLLLAGIGLLMLTSRRRQRATARHRRRRAS